MDVGKMAVLPTVFRDYPGVIAAQSTRHGGVSRPPFATLNLGLHTLDDPGAVRENRRRFFTALGFPAGSEAGSHQVHGNQVLELTAPGQYEGYDALMTDKPGLLLTITVADCVPLLVFDPATGAVGAAHAGWRGTVAGVGRNLLRQMQKAYGTRPIDCRIYIGPSISGPDYEVGPEVGQHFSKTCKKWDPKKRKFFVDLKKANLEQLTGLGVPASQVEMAHLSTFSQTEIFFSHRREQGATGRMLAVIGRRPTL